MSIAKIIATGMSLPARLVRFLGIGALSSLLYVVAVAIFVEFLNFDVKLSSFLAYLSALPVNYFGHRKVTFRSSNPLSQEVIRFIILHGANIAISVLGMFVVVEWLGQVYWLGSLLAVILVPLSTFLIMNFWVFSNTKNPRK